jgi:hypothetical protein
MRETQAQIAESDVTLTDLIERVSKDLLRSEERRREAGRPAVFEVASLDIEISFVVVQSKKRSGGVDLKVVRGDGEKQYQDQQVQRITVHLRGAPEKRGRASRKSKGGEVEGDGGGGGGGASERLKAIVPYYEPF